MEKVGGRWEKMEGHCLIGQSPQWAVVPMQEEEDLKWASAPMILYTNNFICKTQVPYKHFVT